MLAPYSSDWLAEGHLSYLTGEFAETLSLDWLYALYKGDWRRSRPYDSEAQWKLLAYVYASGARGSQGNAKTQEEDVAFLLLGTGTFPEHHTPNWFHQGHSEEFMGILQQVVKLAWEMNLLLKETLAIEGMKVRANVSRHKAIPYGR